MSAAKSTPESRALYLVSEYARLQDQIASCRPRISEALDRCQGVGGKRKEVERIDVCGTDVDCPTDASMKDVTHLSQWYTAETDDDGKTYYGDPYEGECPHCWAAHQVVQERKAAKKSLGAIKGSIRKLGRAALAKAGSDGERCKSCDDTGDVHRADGEYMGRCACASGMPSVVEAADAGGLNTDGGKSNA